MDLQLLTTKQARAVFDAQAVLDLAAREGRDLSAAEKATHETLVKSIEDFGKQIDRVRRANGDDPVVKAIADLTGIQPDGSSGPVFVGRMAQTKSIGQQIIEDELFKAWHRESRHRTGGTWTSPTIEVKATLTEDAASGGALVLPDVQRTIIALPLPPPAVIDLLAPGTTGSNAVGYMAESEFTNAAAPVAEGEVKPESTLTFEAVQAAVRKIGHWLPASEEILEDVAAFRSYIDARLRAGIRVKFDQQLLNGDGVAPNILGIQNRSGLAPSIVRTDPETNADAILRQISAIQTATNLSPDGVVMHPTNWAQILLSKTEGGEYLGAGPFAAIQQPSLWGLPVAVTSAIAVGTALVGSFRGAAQLFLRGPLAVAATNAHADFFIRNLVAIRAEQRGALAVYRPAAFGTITGLQ